MTEASKTQFIMLDNNHNLVVYPADNGKFHGTVIKFPDYVGGSQIRYGTHFFDLPPQDNVENCVKWAKEFLETH